MGSYKLLYSLLQVALGIVSDVPDARVQSGEDWSGLLALSRRQAVTGLVYDALSKLSPEYLHDMPAGVGTAFMLETEKIVHCSRMVSSLADQILDVLRENGIRAVLMKGPSVGTYYPHPEYRTPGDIDLYCPAEQHLPAMDILSRRMDAAGIYRAADGSRHCRIQGIDIDFHARYFDFESTGKAYPDVPSAYATLLMLSSHILKHAMGAGVGLRQICDMTMAYSALSGQYDMARLRALYQSHGLLKWNVLLGDFIAQRLGMGIGLSENPPGDVSFLDKVVESGGNFGNYHSSRASALSGSERIRKVDTLLRLAGHLPFALRYAPGQFHTYLRLLVKGNLG